jgi:hypothetical protein
MLWALTSPATGTTLFVEPQHDETDKETCNSFESHRALRWLQFEVLGPVHYYVFGMGFKGKFDLQPIRSVRAIDAHTFAIEVLDRFAGGPRAWDPGAYAKPFKLTVDWDGNKLRIPELDAIFVRCVGTPRDGFVPAPLPRPLADGRY